MTVVETLVVLGGIPAAIYGLITLVTLRHKLFRRRPRVADDWDFAPVFWVANPSAVSVSTPAGDIVDGAEENAQPATARGGARGNW